jgi:hypothetical protein
LQSDIRSVFPTEWIFTTVDHAAHEVAHGPGSWPSAAAMLAAGKRLLLVSRADYGDSMRPLVFSRWAGRWCGAVYPFVPSFLAFVAGARMQKSACRAGLYMA